MATLFIPEAINLFATDQGPNNSKHLTIKSTTIPKMTEKTQEHHPGGGIGAVQIGGLGAEALEAAFETAGYDPQTMAQFGLGSAGQQPYTIYGVIRDKQANAAIELKAIIFGRLTEVVPGEFKRGDLASQTHKIQEIMHYELYWNKSELYFYDFYSSTWRVNGVDQNATQNSILRISG